MLLVLKSFEDVDFLAPAGGVRGEVGVEGVEGVDGGSGEAREAEESFGAGGGSKRGRQLTTILTSVGPMNLRRG